MVTRSWLDDDTIEPPDPPVLPFREACLPEYRRRLIGIYHATAGWSRTAVAPLWPWIDYASACFEREDAEGWLGALAELERYVGVRA